VYRVAKTYGMPYLDRSFPAESPVISGVFADRYLPLRRRPIGCLILIGHLPQKSPMISGSFTGRTLQLNASYASSPPCSAR